MSDAAYDDLKRTLLDFQKDERVVLAVAASCTAFAAAVLCLMGFLFVSQVRSGDSKAWLTALACAFIVFGTWRIVDMTQRSVWRLHLARKASKSVEQLRPEKGLGVEERLRLLNTLLNDMDELTNLL